MIVAPQPEAVEVGAQVLRAGGNALDAAVAAAVVQGVVDPLMCGVGGFAVMQVHQAGQDPVVFDGLGRVPAAATPDLWADRMLGETSDGFGFIVEDFANEAGAASVLVPGMLAALADAHARFGRLPWADLIGPAAAIARSGWVLRPHVVTVFAQDERRYGRMNYGEKLALSPDGRALYLRPSGGDKQLGDLVVNPGLAEALATIADEGPDTLYGGGLGAHVAEQVQRHGGLLSAADLAAFRSVVEAPVQVDYRGWGVSVPPPPAGGTFLAQGLALLATLLADPPQVGHNDAEHIRLLAEVMKTGMRDKERFGGDPDALAQSAGTDPAQAPVDQVRRLLDPDYLVEVADQIRRGGRVHVPRVASAEPQHTTHVSAMDSAGLTVALTHTLGNPSGFIPDGTGFMLNGGMSVFDPRPGRPNSIAPGKRRLTTMCPTLLFEGPVAVGTLGAPGGSWIGPALLQVVSNLLDWGMGAQEAVSAARVAATSDAIDISNRIPQAVQDKLVAAGYEVRRSPLTYAFAGVHAITRFGGRFDGGADPQRDGYAAPG